MNLKRKLKRGVEHLAARFGQHKRKMPGRLLLLMYHRVLQPESFEYQDEQPGMVVHPDTFSNHLMLIKRYFEPIHLVEWLTRRATGKLLPDNACAITFDDGWRDNYVHAFPQLIKHGFPATIFLVSDYVGSQRVFWPERLARLLRLIRESQIEVPKTSPFKWLDKLKLNFDIESQKLNRDSIDAIITASKIYPDAELHSKLDEMYQDIGGEDDLIQTPQILNWEETRLMQKSGLVMFGSHTRRHTRLTSILSPAQMHDEIIGSKNMIADKLGIAPEVFCYPNGDVSREAEILVRNNYIGACTVSSGYNTCGQDAYQLRRISIHQDISQDEISFLAAISGWI